MAHSSALRRNLFMHPAHRTVGVSGGGIAPVRTAPPSVFRPSRPSTLAVTPMRLALVACRLDADASAALTLLEQAVTVHGARCSRHTPCAVRSDFDADSLSGGRHMECACHINECGRVEFGTADAGSERLADVDCVVLFLRGLHMARRWADLDAAALVRLPTNQCQRETPDHCNGREFGNDRELLKARIEIAPAARRHPILDRVEPFVSRDVFQPVCISPDATLLLTGRTAGEVQPAAWIEHGRGDEVFHTTLGRSDDFRQPDFVRLVRNALAWIGR